MSNFDFMSGSTRGELPQVLEVLERAVYAPRADEVARSLLGHWLLRRVGAEPGAQPGERWCGGEIVETEAYLQDDPACHAYVRQTPRNKTMWGEAGRAYVFNIYGSYKCFNPVCGQPGVAEAVLIRALRPRFGLEAMKALRPVARERDLLSGPSKLCQALSIGRDLDGVDLCDVEGPIILARNPGRAQFLSQSGTVVVCTRIGLTRGADLPLRFYLQNDPNISKKASPGEIFASDELGS